MVRHISGVRLVFPNVIPTSSLYKNLGILKYDDVYDLFLSKFMHFLLYRRNETFIDVFSNYLPSSNYKPVVLIE